MNDNKPTPNAAAVLDEVTKHAADDAAENGPTTAEDLRWSREVGVRIEARLAELRRNLTPADVPTERDTKPIRASTLAMTRDALVAAITRITETMGGAVQYAHRNLKGLSDDDLRRLYDTLDPTARDRE